MRILRLICEEVMYKYTMYACMYESMISFAFDLGRSFYSISLKLGKTVVSIENWCCIVFGSIRPSEGRAGVTQIREFLEKENLTTDFSEIQ